MGRTLTGTVVSDKNDKTIIISVIVKKTHPVYKKQYTRGKRFSAHDDTNQAKVGDLVSITETRPMSASKRFKLLRIIERAGARFEESDAIADVEVLNEEPAPAAAKKDTK